MGEFPSGQRGQTVNLLLIASVVRIHLPPPSIRNPNFFPIGGWVRIFLFISRIFHIAFLCQQCRFDAGLLALSPFVHQAPDSWKSSAGIVLWAVGFAVFFL